MSKPIQFAILILFSSCFAFLSNYLLISDNLYYNSLGEQLSYNQIERLLQQGKKWEWLSYVLLPVITLIKLLLVTSCLSIGIFFANNKFSFKSAFGVALEAEFVFLIPIVLKILWFVFFQKEYVLKDIQLFYPLSALNFFDATYVESWLIYPLQLLNVFELLYWLVLARGIQKLTQKDFTPSFEVVMASYGAGLVLWIAIVMFVTVSYS